MIRLASLNSPKISKEYFQERSYCCCPSNDCTDLLCTRSFSYQESFFFADGNLMETSGLEGKKNRNGNSAHQIHHCSGSDSIHHFFESMTQATPLQDYFSRLMHACDVSPDGITIAQDNARINSCKPLKPTDQGSSRIQENKPDEWRSSTFLPNTDDPKLPYAFDTADDTRSKKDEFDDISQLLCDIEKSSCFPRWNQSFSVTDIVLFRQRQQMLKQLIANQYDEGCQLREDTE